MNLAQEENRKTIRQQMITCLIETDMSARDLSRALGIREKEVVVHLSHIGRTAAAQGKKLFLHPFHCLSCGYVFKDRKRFTRPGRCPHCKGTHLESPIFRIL